MQTPSYGSSKNKSSRPMRVGKGGINPAYLIGGVAAAGAGVAALSSQQNSDKTQETTLGNISGGVLAVTDGISGAASTVASYASLPMIPLFFGQIGLMVAGLPASAAAMAGWQAPAKGLEKAGTWLQKAGEYNFSDLSRDVKSRTGHDLGKTAQTIATTTAKTAAPVLDTLSKAPGLSGLHSEHVAKLPTSARKAPVLQTVADTAFITHNITSIYGIARGVGEQLVTLRQLQADLTGKKLQDISTFSILLGSVEKPVAEARSKIMSLAGVHTLAELAGVALVLKHGKLSEMVASRMGGGMLTAAIGMMAWQVPDKIAELADGIIGDSILPIYKGMRDAQQAGAKLTAEDYAQLRLANSPELRDRGRLGQSVALELGKLDAEANKSVVGVVQEKFSGKQAEDIKAMIAAREAAKKAAPAVAPAAEPLSTAQRILQAKQSSIPHDSHAARVQAERAAAAQHTQQAL